MINGNVVVAAYGTFTSSISSDGSQTDVTIGGDLVMLETGSGESSMNLGTGSVYVNGVTSGNGTINGNDPADGVKGNTSEADTNLQSLLNTIETETSADSILPVELISFTAKQDADEVVLNWSTAYEINHDYFEVQVSVDGLHYEALTRVYTGSDSEHLRNYEHRTQLTSLKARFYRLKLVSTRNEIRYSNIVFFVPTEGNLSEPILVYPNPTEGLFQIQLDRHIAEYIFLIRSDGMREQIPFKIDTWGHIHLDLRQKQRGIYLVELVTHLGPQHVKVILK